MLRHAPRSKLTAFRDGIILFLKLVMSDEPGLWHFLAGLSAGVMLLSVMMLLWWLLWKFLFLI